MNYLLGWATGNIKGDKKMETKQSKIFMSKVKEVMIEKNCTIEAAANIVRRKHPALHVAYMNELLSLSGYTFKE